MKDFKDWTPLLFTGGLFLLAWLFLPRLLDIVEKRSSTTNNVDDLVQAIANANARAETASADAAAAAAAAAAAKVAADKAAADAAAAADN